MTIDPTLDATPGPAYAPRLLRGSPLFEEYRERIRRYLRGQCRDAHMLDDLVQETLLRGMCHADRLREPDLLPHWLLRIAWNVALDWRRRRVRRPELCVDSEVDELVVECADGDAGERAAQAERAVAREEWRLALRRALRGLKPLDRMLVIGHYFVGLHCAELATRSRLTRANVKVRLCRARRTLRRLLPDGFELDDVRVEVAAPVRRRGRLERRVGRTAAGDGWAEAV